MNRPPAPIEAGRREELLLIDEARIRDWLAAVLVNTAGRLDEADTVRFEHMIAGAATALLARCYGRNARATPSTVARSSRLLLDFAPQREVSL
jgi:hypothetical protein